MKRKNKVILQKVFSHPISANIKWSEIEALFLELGVEISAREGSRVGVKLFGDRRIFHRPHPSPNIDKGAVVSIRDWLKVNGVKP